MPGLVIKGDFPDLQAVRDSLDALEVGLAPLVGKTAAKRLGPVIAEVEQHLPYDPTHRGWKGWDPSWASKDPGHVRSSVVGAATGNGLVIRSTHPGGPVHWWGGTIAPSGHPITITRQPGAGLDFAAKTADKVARDVENALDRLCREHGL
jgi:hypothetical protein